MSLCTALHGCGQSYKIVKVKNYHLALVAGDSSNISVLKSLINRFNQDAGMQVLHFDNDTTLVNSPVEVTQGIDYPGGAPGQVTVGLGAFYTKVVSEDESVRLLGRKPKATMYYGMKLTFDQETITSSLEISPYRLFCHEVGHGLELDHDSTDVHGVMYPNLLEDPETDFSSFFLYVKNYVKDSVD